MYLSDAFSEARKALAAGDANKMFAPIEGPHAGCNTRLGMATVILWHSADHNDQMLLYLRENGIAPPASRPNAQALSNPE